MSKTLRSNKLFNYLLPIFGGILGGFAFSSHLWIFLMPISISILWCLFEKKYSNFLWGFSLVLISHYWLLYLHPLTWLGFSWISSIFICCIILFSCALLGGLFVMLWGFIGNKIISKKCIFSKKDNYIFMRVALISLVWSFGEIILSKTSYFWIGIGESLIPGDLYFAGLASLIGSAGVSFLVQMIGFWIFYIFVKWKNKKNINKEFLSGITIIFLLHLIGGYLIHPSNRIAEYPIAIWQTNTPTREKLFLSNQKTTDKMIFQQEKAISKGAKLLVAPEGTLNTNFVFQQPSKIDTLIGGFRKGKNNVRNSLLGFKKGEKFYSHYLDKYRLVPFGEKVPNIFSKFLLDFSSLGGIEPGNKKRFFKWENKPPFAAVICYEITDGLQIRDAIRNGSKFILSIANLDPYPSKLFDQYLSLARMRSIENNIDTVIVSNTGPSGLIRNDARFDKLLESRIENIEVVDIHLLKNSTFYNRFGLYPLIISFIFILIYINFFEKVN